MSFSAVYVMSFTVIFDTELLTVLLINEKVELRFLHSCLMGDFYYQMKYSCSAF